MKLNDAHKAIRVIAQNRGVSVNRVIREIEDSIKAAMENAKKSNDIEALNMWGSISCKGDVPSAAEFIAYISEETNKKSKNTQSKPDNGLKIIR